MPSPAVKPTWLHRGLPTSSRQVPACLEPQEWANRLKYSRIEQLETLRRQKGRKVAKAPFKRPREGVTKDGRRIRMLCGASWNILKFPPAAGRHRWSSVQGRMGVSSSPPNPDIGLRRSPGTTLPESHPYPTNPLTRIGPELAPGSPPTTVTAHLTWSTLTPLHSCSSAAGTPHPSRLKQTDSQDSLPASMACHSCYR